MKTLISFTLILLGALLFSQSTEVQKLNDDAVNIYREDSKKALSLLKQAAEVSSEVEDKELTNSSYGIVYRFLGEFEKAKEYSLKAIGSKNLKIQAAAYNNIGAVNRSQGKYEEAIKFYINALENYEALKNDKDYATVSNNIGVVYNSIDLFDKAKEYHQRAIDTFQKIDYKKGMSEAYNNYAMALVNQDSLDTALDFFVKSLNMEVELNDKVGMSESLNNIGGIYYYKGETGKALDYFKEVLALEKSENNLGGVASTYNNIAYVLLEQKETKAAKAYIDSAYDFSRKNKISEDYLTSIENYIIYNEQLQKFREANEFYKTLNHASDSIRQANNLEKLYDVETKYQTEKKEKEILMQRADLAEQRLSLEKKTRWMYVLGFLALLTGLTGYQINRNQKLKNIQLKKENEFKDTLIKIEAQNRVQEERLRISKDLHDNIGSQLTFIISSLDNIKHRMDKQSPEIQEKLEGVNQFTRMTISELRDTIWAMNRENISFEELQTRIVNFIENAKAAAPHIEFNLNISEIKDGGHDFSMLQGISLFRTIQEAINNAMKHSGASRLNLDFFSKGKKQQIIISDNGSGIEKSKMELGNGLSNMKSRIADLGGDLKIESEEGKGTRITITI
ncbi:MAG: sensor histidine kinase [Weeksellaceae bacterium]